MIALASPIMFAAMPTQRERFASNVSFKSSAIGRSSALAGSAGRRRNETEVMIGRCMVVLSETDMK